MDLSPLAAMLTPSGVTPEALMAPSIRSAIDSSPKTRRVRRCRSSA